MLNSQEAIDHIRRKIGNYSYIEEYNFNAIFGGITGQIPTDVVENYANSIIFNRFYSECLKEGLDSLGTDVDPTIIKEELKNNPKSSPKEISQKILDKQKKSNSQSPKLKKNGK